MISCVLIIVYDISIILSEAQPGSPTGVLYPLGWERSRRNPTLSTSPKPSEPFQPHLPIATHLTTHTSAVHQNKRAATPPPPPDLTTAQLALETRLKDWRRDEAKAAGLPTFFIFSDTVLRNITLAAPNTLDDLSQVRGASPEKLARFGVTILELCRA